MENMNLSDKSREALNSEVFQKLREDMEDEIVKEYLKNGYTDDDKQHEITVNGVKYKALEREKFTAFYDSLGNTLFDIDNGDLAALSEYNYGDYGEKTDAGGGHEPEDDKAEIIDASEEERSGEDGKGEDFKEKACEKLRGELKKADDKQFADPVIGYLMKRCEEDAGLAQDVTQEHKTWKKCMKYIFDQARKQAKGNQAAVRYDVVYEWAEDYYHKDDKAEEERKAKEAAERKKKEEERRKKCMKAAEKKETDKKNVKQNVKKEDKAEENPAEQPKPTKAPKEMDGQMDLFSMMGM